MIVFEIFTQARTLRELRQAIRDAVRFVSALRALLAGFKLKARAMWEKVTVPPTHWCVQCHWPLEPGREAGRVLCWVCEDMLAALNRNNDARNYWRARQSEWERECEDRRRMLKHGG